MYLKWLNWNVLENNTRYYLLHFIQNYDNKFYFPKQWISIFSLSRPTVLCIRHCIKIEDVIEKCLAIIIIECNAVTIVDHNVLCHYCPYVTVQVAKKGFQRKTLCLVLLFLTAIGIVQYFKVDTALWYDIVTVTQV